jgi:hypothetical protein
MDPRYPMPPELHHWMQEIERQIRDLGTAPSLTRSSISDDDGNLRVRFGELDEDGSFGMQVFDANGDTVFKANDVGLTDPAINLPYRGGQAPIGPITSSAFVLTWETSLGAVTHDSIQWSSLIATDAGTTAEAQLRVGGTDSAIQSIPASNSTHTSWAWKPPLTIAKHTTSGPLVQLYVRRASGAGGVYAYGPDVLYLANGADIDATATGV